MNKRDWDDYIRMNDFTKPAPQMAPWDVPQPQWPDFFQSAALPPGAGESAAAEAKRAVNDPALRLADRDEFLREIAGMPGASAALVQAVVRAFTVTVLRGRHARSRDGWEEVFRAIRVVLGTALSEGVREVRLAGMGTPPPPPVPVEPPIAPWELVAHYGHAPTAAEAEANRVYWEGLPVRLVDALVRAHVAARFRDPEAATPEGRSAIVKKVRRLLWDALLEAVSATPPPLPVPQGRRQKPQPGRGPRFSR